MDQSPDEDVAAAFSSGQPDALALVYQRFGALVYSIALRSLRARSDAEDVTQQVLVSAWQPEQLQPRPRYARRLAGHDHPQQGGGCAARADGAGSPGQFHPLRTIVPLGRADADRLPLSRLRCHSRIQEIGDLTLAAPTARAQFTERVGK